MPDAGQALDHQRDTRKGPQLTDNPIGRSALEQCPLDLGELSVGDSRVGAGRPAAAQRVDPAVLPAGVPVADTLAGDAELAGDLSLDDASGQQLGGTKPAGDLSLDDASGQQLGGTKPAGLEPLALLVCRRAARDGWHPLILPRQRRQPKTRLLRLSGQSPKTL
jgi:hypothetical protein